MKRQLTLVVFLVSISLLATGCFGLLGKKEVAVSGTVTVNGRAPGDLKVTVTTGSVDYKTEAKADGKFTLMLPAGTHNIGAYVEAGGFYPAMATVNVKNQAVTGIKLDIVPEDYPSSTVAGFVTIDGEPLGETEVTVSVAGTGLSEKVKGDGTFSFALVPGTYTLEASGHRLVSGSATVQLQPRQTLTDVEVAMFSIAPGAISGTVTVNGRTGPADGVTLTLGAEGPSVTIGADGGYTFDDVLPGVYELLAEVGNIGMTTVSVTVGAGEEITQDIDVPLTYTAPFAFDFADPAHQWLITKPYPLLRYEYQADPFGYPALFFPQGHADQAPPEGYAAMRYALIDTPDVVDEFRLSVEQIGQGGGAIGGNRSLSFIFGFEDLNNWWVIYYTYTDTTSVRRMKDGKQQYICRPMDVDQWLANNAEYQKAEVGLHRIGDEMVVTALADGVPISIDGCSFPAADYTPGKLGIGGHSTSTVQSWYFKDLELLEF